MDCVGPIKQLNKIIKRELMLKQLDNGKKLEKLFHLAQRLYCYNIFAITDKIPNITLRELDRYLSIEVIKLEMYLKLISEELGYDLFSQQKELCIDKVLK